MKVALSVNGRFHAFDMARALQDRGMLLRLITPLPRNRAVTWGISPERVCALPWLEALKRLKNIGGMENRRRITALQSAWFDSAVARRLPADTDVFVGFAGSSLASLKRARAIGAATVLQRSSVHIEAQVRLLEDEYARRGGRFVAPLPVAISRELEEYATADIIEVPSRFVARSFLDRGFSPERISIIPLGVDLNVFKPEPKEDGVFRVIFAGGFTYRKGAAYLLEALAGLELPNFEFWHLGSIHPEMQPLVDRFAAPHIKFLGHIDQARLGWHYSQGSALILPSIEDGFGMVVPQAMACGLAVICSEAAGAAEILEHGRTGLIIPPGDVGAIAGAVRRLYSDSEETRRIGAAARDSLGCVMTWAGYGERIAATYSEVAARRRG